MCGRYTVFTEEEIIEMRTIIDEVNRRFSSDAGSALKTGEIRPTDVAPIIGIDGGRLAPRPAKWGFPKWDGKGQSINARAETVKNLPTFSNTPRAYRQNPPAFRSPIIERRCIVPSTGFYEWNHVDGKSTKEKYLLRLPGEQMLYMAGIANIYKDVTGQSYEAYCILTTDASKSVAEIHDRMPVILSPDEQEKWLADEDYMNSILARRGPELDISLVLPPKPDSNTPTQLSLFDS